MSARNTLTIIATMIAAATTMASAGEKLVIKGSDTLGAKLVPQLKEGYVAAGNDTTFEIAAEGSSTAFSNLIAGTADIGMSSRKIKEPEAAEAAAKGLNLVESVAAFDLIAVIVNGKNPIANLTLGQVEEIFTGDITDWSEVGGKPGPISVYTRNTSSGTYADFQKMAMDKRDYGRDSQKMAGNEQIAAEVGKNPNGIGYVGLAYLGAKGIAPVKIDAAAPVAADVASYPLARETYFYTNGAPAGEAKKFLDFCRSESGAKIVTRVGFIPVSALHQ